MPNAPKTAEIWKLPSTTPANTWTIKPTMDNYHSVQFSRLFNNSDGLSKKNGIDSSFANSVRQTNDFQFEISSPNKSTTSELWGHVTNSDVDRSLLSGTWSHNISVEQQAPTLIDKNSVSYSKSNALPLTMPNTNVFQNIWSSARVKNPLNKTEDSWDYHGSKLDVVSDSTETLNEESTFRNQASAASDAVTDTRQSQHSETPTLDGGDCKVADDLISQILNTGDGWSSQNVDQSTPWESIDQNNRTSSPLITAALPVNNQHESNVWKSEPPIGTGVWQLHYEQLGNKLARIQRQTRNEERPVPLVPNGLSLTNNNPLVWNDIPDRSAQGCDVPSPTQPHFVNSTQNTLGSFRRPAVCTATTNQPSVKSAASTDVCWFNTTDCPPVNPNIWTSSKPHSYYHGPEDVEPRSQQLEASGVGAPTIHPYSHTYRADLVRYFTQMGFRREEVLGALIECNMDIDRASALLRQRFRNTPSTLLPPPTLPARFPLPSSAMPFGVTAAGSHEASESMMMHPLNDCSVVPSNLATTTTSAFTNERVQSSFPQSLTGPRYSALLRRPPEGGQPSCGGGGGPPSARLGRWASPPSPSCVPNLAYIRDLRKKKEDILRQMKSYRNNPTLCSQPQYAALLMELTSQLRYVEANLRAQDPAYQNLPPPQTQAPWGGSEGAFCAEEEHSFNASLLQRLHGMRISGGGGGGVGVPRIQNPPSPRDAFRNPQVNGHWNQLNCGNNWLLIRGSSSSTANLESLLTQMPGLLQFLSLQSGCAYLARFAAHTNVLEAAAYLNNNSFSVEAISGQCAQNLLIEATRCES